MGPQPVALADHDGRERDGEAGADDEEPGDVADVGPGFDVGSDHEAGGVAEKEDREVEGVAELHEPGGLVGTVGVDGAAEMGGVVGDDADGAALDAAQRGDHPRPERASQLEHGVGVGECVDDGPDVVCPESVLGHQGP